MHGSRRWYALAALLVAIFLFAPQFADVYVDSLWFHSVGYSQVFWYGFWMKWGLFTAAFLATVLILRGAFWLLQRAFVSYRLAGSFTRADQQKVEIDPERYIAPGAWGVALVWGFLIGAATSGQWNLFTLYFHRTPGASTDPIFARPLGYFLFAWPVEQIIASWLSGLCFILFLATVGFWFLCFVSHLPTLRRKEALRTASLACSLALAALLITYAWNLYLSRFSLIWQDNDTFSGIGYTEAHIVLPGTILLALTLLASAGLSVANALLWRRGRLVAVAFGVPLLAYFGLGLTTNYVSNFIVKPNELVRQTPYIKFNIDGTRKAFGLDRMMVRPYPAAPGLASLDLRANGKTLDNIRLWDWRALQATLRQVQVLRTYYDFPDVDIDRYHLNGQLRQVMLAGRELDVDRLPPASRNWVNDRLVYTHGYGVTMNTVDGFTAEGRPNFLLSDVPVRSTVPGLSITRPEIYFGQLTDTPVYVKTKQKEFDFPQGDSNAYTTYAGTGGISLSGPLQRFMLAWSLGDLTKIPFSSDITSESRVLMYRNIRDRVQKIAPFLSYDSDPYLVVSKDGRLYWMIDAFTSSIYYPYSRHYAIGGGWGNYLRNSVKITIDAYNGTTTFYDFDPADPVLAAYRGAFPGMFHEASEMPADLHEHVRYPETLFSTQADVYGLYHMQDVRLFFGREDVWSVAGGGDDPASAVDPAQGAVPPGAVPQDAFSQGPMAVGNSSEGAVTPLEPYFVLMSLPGEKAGEEFVQILPFTPSNRRNMIGWMAGRSDGAAYGSLLTYNFPKSQLVDGPAQIKARINQDPFLSGQFTLWNQQGSTVRHDDMLVIPLGRSLLYVEPIFLQANQSPTPELRLVVLATQDRIAYGISFRAALAKLLGAADESVGAGDALSAAQSGSAASTAAAPQGDLTKPGKAEQAPAAGDRQQLINRAADDLEAYQKLTAQGRYSEAGQRLESVRETLGQLRLGTRK